MIPKQITEILHKPDQKMKITKKSVLTNMVTIPGKEFLLILKLVSRECYTRLFNFSEFYLLRGQPQYLRSQRPTKRSMIRLHSDGSLDMKVILVKRPKGSKEKDIVLNFSYGKNSIGNCLGGIEGEWYEFRRILDKIKQPNFDFKNVCKEILEFGERYGIKENIERELLSKNCFL